MQVRGCRGAILVERDDRETVLAATERLLSAMLESNCVGAEDIVSVIFTATEDLRSVFPAEAARRMGLGRAPLLCTRELDVEGAMPRVVRILLHFHTDRAPADVEPVYLDGAEVLRDDL